MLTTKATSLFVAATSAILLGQADVPMAAIVSSASTANETQMPNEALRADGYTLRYIGSVFRAVSLSAGGTSVVGIPGVVEVRVPAGVLPAGARVEVSIGGNAGLDSALVPALVVQRAELGQDFTVVLKLSAYPTDTVSAILSIPSGFLETLGPARALHCYSLGAQGDTAESYESLRPMESVVDSSGLLIRAEVPPTAFSENDTTGTPCAVLVLATRSVAALSMAATRPAADDAACPVVFAHPPVDHIVSISQKFRPAGARGSKDYGHSGLDIVATGAVYAVADGVVRLHGRAPLRFKPAPDCGQAACTCPRPPGTPPGMCGRSYGNFVVIDFGEGRGQVLYAHLADDDPYFLGLVDSQPILAGTRIGTVGATGGVTGLHLHLEVSEDLTPVMMNALKLRSTVDPEPCLAQDEFDLVATGLVAPAACAGATVHAAIHFHSIYGASEGARGRLRANNVVLADVSLADLAFFEERASKQVDFTLPAGFDGEEVMLSVDVVYQGRTTSTFGPQRMAVAAQRPLRLGRIYAVANTSGCRTTMRGDSLRGGGVYALEVTVLKDGMASCALEGASVRFYAGGEPAGPPVSLDGLSPPTDADFVVQSRGPFVARPYNPVSPDSIELEAAIVQPGHAEARVSAYVPVVADLSQLYGSGQWRFRAEYVREVDETCVKAPGYNCQAGEGEKIYHTHREELMEGVYGLGGATSCQAIGRGAVARVIGGTVTEITRYCGGDPIAAIVGACGGSGEGTYEFAGSPSPGAGLSASNSYFAVRMGSTPFAVPCESPRQVFYCGSTSAYSAWSSGGVEVSFSAGVPFEVRGGWRISQTFVGPDRLPRLVFERRDSVAVYLGADITSWHLELERVPGDSLAAGGWGPPEDIPAGDAAVVHKYGAAALRVSPNPARENVDLRVAGGSAGNSRVEIFDSGGRRVRRLIVRGDRVQWDLHDRDGRLVPNGIYLLRVAGAGAAVRLVVLR